MGRCEVWEAIAAVDERYQTKRDVDGLARKFFETKAQIAVEKPGAPQRLSDFIEFKYLPAVKDKLRPSTVFGYKSIFRKHLRNRLCGIRLFDFDAAAAPRLLRAIACEAGLSHTSRKRLKHFLAGVINLPSKSAT